VTSRGKKIIFLMRTLWEKGQVSSGTILYMISSLGMEGHWQYKEGKHSGIRFDIGKITCVKLDEKTVPSSQTVSQSSSQTNSQSSSQSIPSIMPSSPSSNIKLLPCEPYYFKETEHQLYYDDSRHFGTLNIIRTQDEYASLFKDVGPDLLRDNITIEQYTSVITRSNISRKTIMWFLLEQKYFSGVGNYLRSEIMYVARLNPTKTLGSLTKNDIISLYVSTLQILQESLKSGGLTLSTYWDPDGNVGKYQVRVYGRDQDSVGNQVQQIREAGRTVHWVPNIQS
jgi:formamidopyrimidine-DNA glycosylase